MDAHQHQQDIDHAKEQIHDSTQKADSYLTELTKSVEQYEKKHSDFEPAGQYLKSALDASRSATQKLKTQGQDLSEKSVPAAIDGMKEVRESLDDLQKRAVEYDDKYAGSSGQQAMDTFHDVVNSGRQRATDALETTNEQLMKLRDAIGNVAGQATHGAQVAVGEAVRAAEFGDEKLGVSAAAGGVAQFVKDLDTRLGVTETAAKVDTTVTGGLGCQMAASTVDMVTEGVNYISETLYNTKLVAEGSETGQSVEAKGDAVAEKTEEKAGEMKDSTSETAGQAKEMAEEKAGTAKDKATVVTAAKAGEAEEAAKDKAGKAQDTAKETKDKAQEKAEMAKEKAGETADQAKGKTWDVKEKSKETAGQAKDKTEEKADESKEQTKGKMSKVADKASEIKDKALRAAHIR